MRKLYFILDQIKTFAFLFLFLSIAAFLPAQTVTQSWASLASGAGSFAIAVDGSGNMYTANRDNNTVSKITPAGEVTQTWAALASNTFPHGIAIDGFGNVYTANNNSTVSKITAGGVVIQTWATLAFGAFPLGIVIDGSGNIYTANYGNHTISKITAGGEVTQTWAALASGAGPYAIAIDGSGNVYTANLSNSTVSKITAGGVVTETWAALGLGTSPVAIAIDGSGNVYTANNNNNNTVSKITPAGEVTRSWAALASNAFPHAIAIDGSGNVYTANNFNHTVSKITAGGVATLAWAVLAPTANPIRITIDGLGNVYTANFNNTVSKITPEERLILTVTPTPASCPNGIDGGVAVSARTETFDNSPPGFEDYNANTVTFRLVPALGVQFKGKFTNLPVGNYTVEALVGETVRATADFSITGAADVTPPVVTCPQDVTLEIPNTSCTAVYSYEVGVFDNCTVNIVPSQTRGLSSGSTFPLGTTINTFYAYDEARNESVPCSFAVTVQDLTRPTIQVQDLIVVPANADCEAVNVQLPQPTVADNCTATTDLVVRNNAPLVFPLGSTKVKWTVKDASGNEATAETEVIVADKTRPTILPLSPISVEANVSNCRATVALERPLVQDNCTQENITISNDAPAVFPLGETTVTWTVKDRVGNISTATQVVTVTKSIQPLTLVLKKDPNCNATASGELRVITTGAGNVAYSIAPNVGAQPFAGRFTNLPARANYRITARDANGCTETFNSGLVQPPALVLSTPQTTPLLCRGGVDGTLSVSASGGTPGYTYTISPNTYVGFSAPGHFVGLRAGDYTVSVTDANGCIATQPATITQPARLVTMRPPVITNVACPDGREGRIVVSAQGGVGAFTYTLFPMPAGAVQRPAGTFTNLGAGTYSVLASDANNCSISVPVTILGPTIEPNKCYSVVNVQSNLALAVPTGQTANNLQALQVATNASSAEQLWRFPTATNNTRKMIVQQAGKYLSNTVNAENAPAFQAANATNGSRDWELICLGSGAYFIKNKLTGKLLSVENAVTTPNAKIVVKSLLTNSKSQEWRLEEAACPNNNSLTGDVPETTASDETNTSFAEVLFPNPANEEVSIDLTAFNNTKVQVSIVDLTGKILSYQTVVGGIVHKERLESYVSGHYIVKVAVEGGETEVFQLKIVKQ